MTTTTTRPAHVPAPIAKVDGDLEAMQLDHLRREAQAASRNNATHPYALTWYGAEVHGVNVVLYRTIEGRDIGISQLREGVMFAVWPPAPSTLVDTGIALRPSEEAAPTPTDPRDAELEALRAERDALLNVVYRVTDAVVMKRPQLKASDAMTLTQAYDTGYNAGYNQALREVMKVITEFSTPVES